MAGNAARWTGTVRSVRFLLLISITITAMVRFTDTRRIARPGCALLSAKRIGDNEFEVYHGPCAKAEAQSEAGAVTPLLIAAKRVMQAFAEGRNPTFDEIERLETIITGIELASVAPSVEELEEAARQVIRKYEKGMCSGIEIEALRAALGRKESQCVSGENP
jgi:hypothetical protein